MKKLIALLVGMLLCVQCCFVSPHRAFAETLETDDGFRYEITEDNTVTITAYLGTATDVVVPEEIDGLPVTALGTFAFGITPVESVVLPDSVTVLGEDCFRFCLELTSITLSKNITAIPESCFEWCEKLTSIILPDGLTSFGASCFHLCSSLSSIKFHEQLESVPEGGFDDAFLREFTIPDSVTEIGTRAFSQCCFESVTLSKNITEIPDYCFTGCSALRDITIQGTITQIGFGAFSFCSSLTAFEIPETITEIPQDCFKNCRSLSEITIPKNITDIGAGAFSGCSSLTAFEIPEAITAIYDSCFEGCTLLSEIAISERITEIGASAFSGCGLISLTLHKGITKIGSNAFSDCASLKEVFYNSKLSLPISLFENCTALETVAIADGVSSIQSNAFANCPALVSATIPGSVISVEDEAFTHCPSLTIHGEYSSAAHKYALQNGFAFAALTEVIDSSAKPVAPAYGSETLSFGNTGAAFGSGYYLDPWHRALLLDAAAETGSKLADLNRGWGGSCYGMSVVTLLINGGILTSEMLDENAQTLYEVQPTEQALSVINYYQYSQYLAEIQTMMNTYHGDRSDELLLCVKQANAVNHGGQMFLIKLLTAAGGVHSVIGYGVEAGEWEWDGVTYYNRILIWDSNYPAEQKDACCLYFDLEALRFHLPAYGIYYSAVADTDMENAGFVQYLGNSLALLNAYACDTAMPMAGDVNRDDTVGMADAVLLSRVAAEDAAVSVSATGCYNADCNSDTVVDVSDVAALLRRLQAAA